MARNNRFQPRVKKKGGRGVAAAPQRPPSLAERAAERGPAPVYGKPFVVLEDAQKSTFIYKGGAWVSHDMSIAECRINGQVTELPQKVKQMTRYEVRSREN
jgi:hypothetical protein